MKLVPLTYSFRSLWVRRSATLLTVFSIGATVAMLASVLALQQGFQTLYTDTGREDVFVLMRPGSNSEGLSAFPRSTVNVLLKNLDEVALDDTGRPLSSAESFLAVRLHKRNGGGETNVPIRGVQPRSFDLAADSWELIEGRRFEPGTDQVIVGRKLADRIENCGVGDVLSLNTTPFEVVGVFDGEGPEASEIWGDVDRIMNALERGAFNRVIVKLKPDTDVEAFRDRMAVHSQQPATVQTEREYLSGQSGFISALLFIIAAVLGAVMGVAAIFTSVNTMLSALVARTKEVGILLSIGYRPVAIFIAFMIEATLLGLVGGVVGCFLALPVNGVETGTSNMQTFTEVGFAFQLSPGVLGTAVIFAMVLGLIGGGWPALKAARLKPTDALRR